MMKTQYIKPEIQMVLLEKKLMASNSISWTVDNSNKENDPFTFALGNKFKRIG